MNWDKLYDAFKDMIQSPRMALVLTLFSAILLLLPFSVREALSLTELLGIIRPFVAVAFILSLVVLLVNVGYWYKEKREDDESFRQIMEGVRSLSQAEQGVLGFCLLRGQQSLNLKMGGVANSLVAKRLLVRTNGHGTPLSWGHIIPPRVWKELQAMPLSDIVGNVEEFKRSGFLRGMERGQSDWMEFPESL